MHKLEVRSRNQDCLFDFSSLAGGQREKNQIKPVFCFVFCRFLSESIGLHFNKPFHPGAVTSNQHSCPENSAINKTKQKKVWAVVLVWPAFKWNRSGPYEQNGLNTFLILVDKQTLWCGLAVIPTCQSLHVPDVNHRRIETHVGPGEGLTHFPQLLQLESFFQTFFPTYVLFIDIFFDTWRESSRNSGLSVGSWLSRILRARCVKSVVEYFPSWPHATPSFSWRSYPHNPGPSQDP